MDTHSLQYVIKKLAAAKGKWREISLDSKVSYHTLTKVAQGRVKNPRVGTVEALAKYFSKANPRGVS